jgi:hypothetical protein
MTGRDLYVWTRAQAEEPHLGVHLTYASRVGVSDRVEWACSCGVCALGCSEQ